MDLKDFPNEVKIIDILASRIFSTLSSVARRGIEFQDLKQAGMIGLWKAIRCYDASRGAKFNTYAGIRIRGEILDTVRVYSPLPKVSKNHPMPYYITVSDIEHEEFDQSSVAYVLNTDHIDLTKHVKKLKSRERMVINSLLQGYRLSEIEPHLSESRTSQIHLLAKNDLRRMYRD